MAAISVTKGTTGYGLRESESFDERETAAILHWMKAWPEDVSSFPEDYALTPEEVESIIERLKRVMG